MNAIHYDDLKETIYTEQLDNGLKVFILPKHGFQKTYASFSAHYGSIDNHFQAAGQSEQLVPDGMAHFLEHKMFEEPTGDIFATFAANGASANAYTSFDRTAYLFSATQHVDKNIITLLDFVQNPYFTVENVEKEKGIISQEITMYQDNADWRSYFGLIEAMYKTHPIHIDIAGTIDSISQISQETLYACYNTFYHPNNMILFVVGGVDPNEIISLVRANQTAKKFSDQGDITRLFQAEPYEVKAKMVNIHLPISQPKCLFGFKEAAPGLTGANLLRRELVTKIMLDVLFGSASSLYQALYDDQLISDHFGYEYNCSSDYAFSIIGGDTKNPEQLIDRMKQYVMKVIDLGVDNADFTRSRKKKMGSFLKLLNSPEALANEFVKYQFRGSDFFEILHHYQQITLEEVNERLREHFIWEQMAVSIVAGEIG